jgi:catechol 2,3-dioxygenase-like lactoylglutathione lyase family enzyme
MHPNTEGILESSLYVIEVARSARFYEKIFGFQVISDFGERGCAMKAGTRQVLLLFKKGGSRDMASPHDGDGELHIAFAIEATAFGELGSMARGKWNRGRREAHVGPWWLQPLFPRSRQTSPRGCYAGGLVDILSRP